MCKISKTIVACSLVCILLCSCGETKNTSQAYLDTSNTQTTNEDTNYKTSVVKKGDFATTYYKNGEISYNDLTQITSPVTNAYFKRFKVAVGDKVSKGDVIAIIEPDYDETQMEKQKLELSRAKKQYTAGLEQKKSAVTQAEHNLSFLKKKSLDYVKQEIEVKRLKKELAQYIETEEQVKALQDAYDLQIAESKKTKVKANCSGIVASLGSSDSELTEDTFISSGQVIATVRTSNDFILTVPDEEQALRFNMKVKISLGSDRSSLTDTLTGRVFSAGNLSNSQDNTTQVAKINVSKADRAKYDFEQNNIFIEYDTMRMKDVLLVETQAVQIEKLDDTEKYFVYALEDGKMHKRYIVSDFSNDDYYLVEQGVTEGETLVIP